MKIDKGNEVEIVREEGDEDNMLAAQAIGSLTQEDIPGGTTIVYAQWIQQDDPPGDALDGAPPLD